MATKKEPNKGTLPCMVCGEPQHYLNTSHMKTHASGKPQKVSKYRDWVAEKSDLDRNHPAIDSNQLLKPQLWQENRHLFEDWRDWE